MLQKQRIMTSPIPENKMVYLVFSTVLSLFVFLLPLTETVQAALPVMDEIPKTQINTEKVKREQEIAMDNLLGPDIDFPFRPENHRDNSNPIGRIGPISNDNL